MLVGGLKIWSKLLTPQARYLAGGILLGLYSTGHLERQKILKVKDSLKKSLTNRVGKSARASAKKDDAKKYTSFKYADPNK